MKGSKIILWGVGLLAMVVAVGAITVQGLAAKSEKEKVELAKVKEDWTKAHYAVFMDEGIKLRESLEASRQSKMLGEERARLALARTQGAVALIQMDILKIEKNRDECLEKHEAARVRLPQRYQVERDKWAELRRLAEVCGDPLKEELALKAKPKPNWLVELEKENASR